MAVSYAEIESDSTKARYVTPIQKTESGRFAIIGADSPMVTVDVNHQRNHDGRAWFAWQLYPEASKLAAGASCNIVLAAGPDSRVHLTVDALLMGDAELYVYEGATSTGGTAFTPVNRNRNYSTSTSNVAMVINPTVTATGTLLDAQFLPGGVGKKAGGGDAQSLELVLKPLTNYLVRMTNVNGADHPGHLALEWYE